MVDKELMVKIEDVMRAHIGGDRKAHEVAKDFSQAELEIYITTYFDYLMK